MAQQKERGFHELTREERQADFHGKDEILRSHYAQIPAALFYADYLFHDMDEEEFKPSIILYEHGDGVSEQAWKRQAVNIEDLMNYCDRDDVAINPCGYWNNYPKKRLMRRIYAFVMDVDEVRPLSLQKLLDHIEKGRFPRPTAITNSGSGIHFFYILDVAMQVGYREKYLQNFHLAQEIYFMLHKQLEDLYAGVQKHHIGQDYRLVGSLSKYGDITTAWEVGGLWSVEGLAEALEIDVEPFYKPMNVASKRMSSYAKSIADELDLELPDMTEPSVVYDFIAENKDAAYEARQSRKEQTGKGKRAIGWYEDTWNRVYTKTKPGNRFNAMRGLAIVAYKCGISEERFLEDLESLSALWQEQRWKDGDPFNPDNVEAIVRMFRNGERYKRTTRARLEELFGWRWTGKNKRRDEPLPQDEHLELARFRKMQKKRNGTLKNPEGRPRGSGTAQARVKEWRAEHPGATKAECNRATGLDPKTIRKWWDT